MIWVAIALVVVVGPLLLGLIGVIYSVRKPAPVKTRAAVRWNWRLTIVSALLYTLAYNVTFFMQELFLVVPKALTPGLDPTLYHNNHTWTGDHPLASLFQGTGALAIFISGVIFAFMLRWRQASSTLRLFFIWMAYHGLFQSLPQVVIGAINPGNDVGMAMDYFEMGSGAKTFWAVVALGSIPPLAIWLLHRLLGMAEDVSQIETPGARTKFVFLAGTLPAIVSILLIVPFRIPRETIEVLLPPALATIVGMAWMQAGAWRAKGVVYEGAAPVGSITYPLIAVVVLLAIFQLVLRSGIRF
jgi:hypothetical protein